MAPNSREATQTPNVLMPFSAWGDNYADLADQLNGLALRNMGELLVRNMASMRHFSNPERSRESVQEFQREDGDVDYFAAVDGIGHVVGMGYIDHAVQLREHRPRLRIGELSLGHKQIDYPYARPMIRAWSYSARGQHDILPDVYSDLLFRTGALLETPEPIRPWTIEPLKAPSRVHSALAQAGLQWVGPGNWSYGNASAAFSKKVLYARLEEDSGEQVERHGRRQLRTNRRGLFY